MVPVPNILVLVQLVAFRQQLVLDDKINTKTAGDVGAIPILRVPNSL